MGWNQTCEDLEPKGSVKGRGKHKRPEVGVPAAGLGLAR